MTIRSTQLALITVLVFITGIGLSMGFNLWITETTKKPASYAEGDFAGVSNPADIRGSYALSDIAAAFPLDVEILAKAFGVTGNPAPEDFMVKELEELYGEREGLEIGTDSVRYFVALYCGLPFVPKEGTGLLPEAVAILKDRLSPADYAALEALLAGSPVPSTETSPAKPEAETAPLAALEPASTKTQPAEPAKVAPASKAESTATTSAPAEAVKPAETAKTGTGAQGTGTGTGVPQGLEHTGTSSVTKVIKGSTTFGDLLAWGLTKSEISAILGSMGADDVVIRTWLSDQGLEFSTYKTTLQERLDALP